MPEFKSEMSAADNCLCSACHEAGKVIKLELPETRYYDGENLSTKYRGYWLCAKCRGELAHALEKPSEPYSEALEGGKEHGQHAPLFRIQNPQVFDVAQIDGRAEI